MSKLNQTVEAKMSSVTELLRNGAFLMDSADSTTRSLINEINKLQGIYNGLPSDARNSALINDIEDFEAADPEVKAEGFETMRRKLTYGLEKMLYDFPVADNLLANKIAQSTEMTKTCIGMVDNLIATIPTGPGTDWEKWMENDVLPKRDILKTDKEGLVEDMDSYSRVLKGIEFYTAVYSKDPVNLVTGNFIYQKEDFALKCRFPVSFRRFYNALNRRSGCLGSDWNHNFEIYIDINEKKGTATVLLEDGREDIYKKAADDTYMPVRPCGSILEKSAEGYRYVTGKRQFYLFDETGKNTRQEDSNGNGLTLIYEDVLPDIPRTAERNPFRLARIEEDTGSTLYFTYDGEGLLETVTDHVGRSLKLTYQEGRLDSVTDFGGGVSTYSYEENGKIETVTGPRGIPIVTNRYDRRNRTVSQIFPDGGEMCYEYPDHAGAKRERVIVLTEQDGSRIRYVHDGKLRHIRTVYHDGTEAAVSEENYVYNSQDRKSKCIDRNGGRIRYRYDSRGNVIEVTDPLRHKTGFRYDEQSRIIQIRQPDGSCYSYEYDDNGNLLKSIDPLGNTREVRYDRGLPTEIRQPDGSVIRLAYDRCGNLISRTEANGSVTQQEYDSLNRLIRTVSGEGHPTAYVYDLNDNIIKITNAEGNSQEYEYNAAGKVTKITDFDGSVTSYEYNELGKLSEATDPCGRQTRFSYDLRWNLAAVTDPLGNEQQFIYDGAGRLSRVIDQEGYATAYEHDENGNITAVTDPTGARTEIGYDMMNRICEIREADGTVTRYTYDILGNPETVTDPQGGVTKFCYNSASQIESMTDPLGNVTVYAYTPLGLPSAVTEPLGARKTYEYYPGGQLRSVTRQDGAQEHYTYDRDSNVVRIRNGENSVTALSYDCMGRVTAVTNPLEHRRTFRYDAQGRLVADTDENGGTTAYVYSPAGEVIQETDPLGGITRYGYDDAGRLTRMEQYLAYEDPDDDIMTASESASTTAAGRPGALPEARVTAWEYSRRGEATKITTPLGEVTSYRYDGNGRLTAETDGDGYETLYEYSQGGRFSRVRYADGRTAEFMYGPLRRLQEVRDWLGTTVIETDALGRVTKVTDHDGKMVSYDWDALSRRTGITYPDGNRVNYRYSPAGQLEEVSSDTGTTRYVYNDSGRLCERIMPGDTVTRYMTDSIGRVTELVHQVKGELTDRFHYDFDPAGNITEIEKYRRGAAADSGRFHYNYDLLGRLTEAQHGEDLRKYQYDSLGNRIRSERNGITTSYGYNLRSQLVRSHTGDVVTEYGYDTRGNLTEVRENGITKAHYRFDAAGCLAGAVTAGNSTEYLYDGLLRCIRSTEHQNLGDSQQDSAAGPADPIRDTRYILDMTRSYNALLAAEGQENQRFIWGRELLMSEGDHPFCSLSDHVGTPVRLLDGHREDVLAYDEFGVPVIKGKAETAFNNPFGFTGYRIDMSSGLCHAQYRQYSPETGRFISEDPVKDRLNWYGYCYGNPFKYVDPKGASGLSPYLGLTNIAGYTFLEDLYTDLKNLNVSNTNENAVLSSNYISAYKGQIVIKSPLERSASVGGFILLSSGYYNNQNKVQQGINTLQHESGHYTQYQELGPFKYAVGIFIPSASNGYSHGEDYYSQPWEIYADVQGGVQRNMTYWPDAEEMGEKYMKIVNRMDADQIFTRINLEIYNRYYSAINLDFLVMNKDG